MGYVFKSEYESNSLGYKGVICSEGHPDSELKYHIIWITDPDNIEKMPTKTKYTKYFLWALIIVFFYIIYSTF